MNRIYLKSCESMPEIGDEAVALTVTSPPYWNAIDYDIHATDKTQYYRILRRKPTVGNRGMKPE